MTLYVIRNTKTDLYWSGFTASCSVPKEFATPFENSERHAVRLGQNEKWEKLE